jgi:hypothetical protein
MDVFNSLQSVRFTFFVWRAFFGLARDSFLQKPFTVGQGQSYNFGTNAQNNRWYGTAAWQAMGMSKQLPALRGGLQQQIRMKVLYWGPGRARA